MIQVNTTYLVRDTVTSQVIKVKVTEIMNEHANFSFLETGVNKWMSVNEFLSKFMIMESMQSDSDTQFLFG